MQVSQSAANNPGVQNVVPSELQERSSAVSHIGKRFDEVLQSLSESQEETDEIMAKLASGDDIDIHNAMIALEENDLNFKIAMAVRNKLVDAYREVIRMPM